MLALASLSTAFSTLVNTVNIAYDVPETRGWWRRRWLGLLLGFGSVLTGAIAVTLLVVGPLFGRAEDVVAGVGLGPEYDFLWSYLRWPVAFGSLVLWATTMDHLMPNRRTRWRYDLPGGLLTALLWLAASCGLNLYLELRRHQLAGLRRARWRAHPHDLVLPAVRRPAGRRRAQRDPARPPPAPGGRPRRPAGEMELSIDAEGATLLSLPEPVDAAEPAPVLRQRSTPA